MPGDIERYLSPNQKDELKGRYQLIRVIMDIIAKLFTLGAEGNIRLHPLLDNLQYAMKEV